MNRKWDDYEVKHNEKDLLTKKIKLDQTKLNNNSQSILQSTNSFIMNVNTLDQNDMLNLTILSKLTTQSSSNVLPSRKRRSRNPHDISEVTSSTFRSTTNVNGQIRKKSDLSCVVCCAVAHGYNFDAISCESCKAFFRRNALFNMDRLKCRRDGACEITLETRRRCKSCRLKKCFAVGMRKEWILTEEEKVNKKRRIEENRRLRIPNTDESMSLNESLIKPDLDLQTVLFNKNEKPPLQSTSSVQNHDIITNVVMAYNDGIKLDLTGYGWSYPIARKITALYQIINAKNTTALRLISFYKRLYDFDILNEIDKVNLIKTNLHYIFFLHGSLKYDPTHDVYHEENTDDKSVHGVDIREAYGVDSYMRLTKLMGGLHSIVQIDKRIMQVALVIFLFFKGLSTTFDSNELPINNHQQIFQTQNKYVEQLWVFIEKTYGRVRAVYVFSTLIGKYLFIQELIRDIQHSVYEKLDPCQVPPILRSLIQPA